jgi:heparin binding hemagglutinin HbhA
MSKTTTARKPLYAYVGAVDFTVEKARELQKAQLASVKQVRAAVPTVATLPTKVPAYVKELRGEAVTATTKLTKKADKFYDELAARGQHLVSSVRSQRSTKSAVASAKNAVSQAKGATTSARKATRSATKAADTAASKIG